jgi:hypothetical protein
MLDFNIDTSGTPQDVQRRQKLADALMQEGSNTAPAAGGKYGGMLTILNRGLAGALGGYRSAALTQEDRAGQAQANAQFAAFPGSTPPNSLPSNAPQNPPTGAAAASNIAPDPSESASAQPYTAAELADPIDRHAKASPMDPPVGQDRRNMMATILGEEKPGSPESVGVANVIRNRAVDGSYGGDTPSGVVTSPKQFSSWNDAVGRKRMADALADPAQAAKASDAIDQAYGTGKYVSAGPTDPTEGKTHFYDPASMVPPNSVPQWAQGKQGQQIGKTLFFDDPNDAPAKPVQVASNDAAIPAGAAPTQGFAPPGQSAAPAAPADNGVRAWAMGVLQNPRSTPIQQQVAKEALATTMKQETHIQETDKDGNVWDVNKQTGQKTIALKADADAKWGIVGYSNGGQPIYGYPPTREEAAANAKKSPQDTSVDNSTLTGDEFLKTLPKGEADLVKKIAEYDVNPASLSVKGGHREDLLKKVSQYDQDYSMPLYASRAAAIKEFGSGGPSSPAGQITAGNTAIKHAGEMSDALESLKQKNSGVLGAVGQLGIPFASYYAQKAHNAGIVGTGTPEASALSDFRTAKNHFSEEVTKFYAGSGGSEAERDRALANIDEAKSLPELQSAIQQEARLMGGKINTLQDRIKTAMGPGAWKRAMKEAGGEFPIVQQQSADALAKIEKRAAGGTLSAAPAPAGAPDPGSYVWSPDKGLSPK